MCGDIQFFFLTQTRTYRKFHEIFVKISQNIVIYVAHFCWSFLEIHTKFAEISAFPWIAFSILKFV